MRSKWWCLPEVFSLPTPLPLFLKTVNELLFTSSIQILFKCFHWFLKKKLLIIFFFFPFFLEWLSGISCSNLIPSFWNKSTSCTMTAFLWKSGSTWLNGWKTRIGKHRNLRSGCVVSNLVVHAVLGGEIILGKQAARWTFTGRQFSSCIGAAVACVSAPLQGFLPDTWSNNCTGSCFS